MKMHVGVTCCARSKTVGLCEESLSGTARGGASDARVRRDANMQPTFLAVSFHHMRPAPSIVPDPTTEMFVPPTAKTNGCRRQGPFVLRDVCKDACMGSPRGHVGKVMHAASHKIVSRSK